MKKKKRLRINLSNRWLYTFIILGILAIISIGVYAYGTSSPSTFGHSSGEINVDNTLCNAVTGHNCGYDSGGLWSKSGSNIYYTSGNVGIGTSSPSRRLHVVAPANTWKARFSGSDGYIDIGPANSGWAHIYTDRSAFIFNVPVYSIGNAFSSYGNNNLYLQTGGTTRMTISTSGNVNIGGALQVGGSTTYNSGCSYGEYGTIKKCSPGYHLCSCSGDNYNALRWMRLD